MIIIFDVGTAENNYVTIAERKHPLEVKKMVTPEKDYYIINDTLCVYVEIKNGPFRIEGVQIAELIDQDFEVLNISAIYIFRNLKDIISKECGFTNEINILDNNSFYTSINELESNSMINYCYYITPRKAGHLDTNTLVHVRNSYYSDLDVSQIINVIDPKQNPQFNIEIGKMKQISDDVVLISYVFTHIGDLADPITYNILMDDIEEATFLNGNSMLVTFYPHETKIITIYLKYSEYGTYLVPGIWVEGKYYSFPDTLIEIEDPFSKDNIIYYTAIMSCFALVISSAVGFVEYSRRRKNSIPKDRISSDNSSDKMQTGYQ